MTVEALTLAHASLVSKSRGQNARLTPCTGSAALTLRGQAAPMSSASWSRSCQIAITAKRPTATARFEHALAQRDEETHLLRLYVTGMTPKSMRAIENLRAICKEHLQGRYDLEIIETYQRPQLMQGEQIVSAPTLIKKLPAPLRRVVGDLSNRERVLLGLDLRPKQDGTPRPGR